MNQQVFTDEILRLDVLINAAANKFFGDVDQEKIIAELLSEDNRFYINTFERLSCAIAINSIGLASCEAIRGSFGEALRHMLHASQHLGICLERSEGRKEISESAKTSINARHDRPGGARDLKKQINDIWATGKYSSKDICAEEEYAALGFGSFKAARNALKTPKGTV